MSNEQILSFNAGELSPKIDARIDTEKYRSGCRRLRNMIPTKYGGAERRPGTKYLNSSYGSATTVRLIPFIYSASVVYIVEMGNLYFRLFYGDSVLLDESSNPVVVDTPYETADLFQIQYKQIGDVVWLVHPNYAPRKLQRVSPYSFTLTEIDFRKGPFLTRNDLLDPDNPSTTTLQCTVTQPGQYGSLIASTAIFLPEHVGALFKLVHAKSTIISTLSGAGTSTAITAKGTVSLITRGSWTGTLRIQRNQGGIGWDTYREYRSSTGAEQNISASFTEDDDNVQFRLYSADGSASLRAELTVNDYLQEGIVKVIGVGDSYNTVVEVYAEIASTTATRRWAEGAWSAVRGYPAAITFFEDRACYAGAASGSAADSTQIADYPNLLNLIY